MTAPLRNATRKARSSECFAPAAVRFDALVAVLMPNQPARALRIPPVRKTNGTSGGNTLDISSLYRCSGTLGALVEDLLGTQYILSNNHVLGRSNLAAVGDPVNQPGMIDQNCQTNGTVASFSELVPIRFTKGRKIKWNDVDAAIAEVTHGEICACLRREMGFGQPLVVA